MKAYQVKRLDRVKDHKGARKRYIGVSAKEMLDRAWKPGYPRLAVEPSLTGGHIVGFDEHGKLSPHRPIMADSRDASGTVPWWGKPSEDQAVDEAEVAQQSQAVLRNYQNRQARNFRQEAVIA